MNKNKISIILICLLLVGCQYIDEYLPQDAPPPPAPTPKNITIQPSEPAHDFSGKYYFITTDSTVAINDKYAVVIDSKAITASNILRDNDLNLMALILTSLDNSGGAKYVIFSNKPQILFDNGLHSEARDEYLRYASNLNVSPYTVNRDLYQEFPGMNITFFVPFEKYGFFTDSSMNTLVVKVNDLLYMSGCQGKCEDFMGNVESKILVLANNGNCPTNSLEFVLGTRAEIIVGETLCETFLTDAQISDVAQLEYLGIEFRKISDKVIVS